jgi:hypothetical protein
MQLALATVNFVLIYRNGERCQNLVRKACGGGGERERRKLGGGGSERHYRFGGGL